ncbi:MAG: ParB/RepB/Spo0J family partition protein [Patescibacteria group bacterium]
MMIRKQSGLGRGLGALIPQKTNPVLKSDITEGYLSDTHEDTQEQGGFARIYQIPIEKIVPNSKQPRLHFDHAGLEDLVASIKEHGILQPLIVVKESENRYELIAGERRLRAAKIAEFQTVPAIIRDANEQEKLELAIIENVQRRDLNPIEEARAYIQLKDEFGLTQEQIGERVGKSRPQVANIIRLLELEPEIQEALAMGKISQSNGRTLLAITDRQERKNLFNNMLAGNFTVRQAEAKIPAVRRRPKVIDPNLLELEAKLRVYFGGRVSVKRRPQGDGEIRVEFNSDEDLQRILDKITNNQ